MSRGKLWLAFEALERPAQVESLRDLARSIGCSVLDPKSPNAVRLRTHRERKRVGNVSDHVPNANGNVSEMPVAAGAIVNSDLPFRKTAAKKTAKKPRVLPSPTDDEIAVIRALNAACARHIPGDIGEPADLAHVKGIRKWLKAGFTVADMLLVIEWWPTRAAYMSFKPLECFSSKTLFGKTFADNVKKAKGWSAPTVKVDRRESRPVYDEDGVPIRYDEERNARD